MVFRPHGRFFRSEEEEIGLHRPTQRINVLVVDTCEAKPVPVGQRAISAKAAVLV